MSITKQRTMKSKKRNEIIGNSVSFIIVVILALIVLFPIWWILHPFYVVVFGIWGQIGRIQWKDQEFKRSLQKSK